MSGETLPGFGLASIGGGDLTKKCEQLLAGVDLDDIDRQVLAVMILQLARSIDASSSRGRASAAAMAARELREALTQLRAVDDDPAGEADPFAEFRALLIGAVDNSAGSHARG